MPVVAVTLQEAVALTNTRVGTGNALGFLFFYISTFNGSWPAPFDPANVNDRTVLNWRPSAKAVQGLTPFSGNPQQRQAVVNSVVRVCYAADSAFQDGRITVAQRDQVLAAWNGSLGALP